MKVRDVNNGQVHNLIRGIYNKNKNNVQTKSGSLPGKPPPPIIKNVSAKSKSKEKKKTTASKKPGEIILDQSAQTVKKAGPKNKC